MKTFKEFTEKQEINEAIEKSSAKAISFKNKDGIAAFNIEKDNELYIYVSNKIEKERAGVIIDKKDVTELIKYLQENFL